MERRSPANGSDVPLPAALALLGIVVLFVFGWDSRVELIFKAERMAQIIENNAAIATIIALSLTLNLVWSSLVLGRVIGLRKQGARLRRIVQDQRSNQGRGKRLGIALAYTATSFLIAWMVVPKNVLEMNHWPFSADVKSYAYAGICVCIGMSLAILVSFFRGIRLRVFSKKKQTLPGFPRPINGIVLGAIGESSQEECA